MKKKTILLFMTVLTAITACTPSIQYYKGYVYNTKNEPIEGLKICEQYSTKCSFTNSQGFFKIKKNASSIRSLIVFHNEISVDTIKTVWSQHGEKINYSFIEGKNDTLFVDLERQHN
ncbi:MAG TPA: hypothetical protein VFD91_13140 [Mariniphaga sp.]|nr:hypothetical protein [Mariniphaga sp.]